MQTQMYSNEELMKKYSEGTKLNLVVKDLEEEQWKSGRVICEIHVNGNYLSEEEEKSLDRMPLSSLSVLEIITRDQSELIEVTLRTIYQWLPKLKERSLEISRGLGENGYSMPTQSFVELIDGCTWFSDSLSLLKPKLQDLVVVQNFGTNWDNCQTVFTSVAKESLKAFELSDWVLLKDILEYEIPVSLDQWQDLLFKQPEIFKIANV